ncbi:MAG TPA: hypothetical protein VMM17_05595 [Gemmatimonadaceae bacterium]|nr:hypothetical protein [Gemmatimonadaceae bacterium]
MRSLSYATLFVAMVSGCVPHLRTDSDNDRQVVVADSASRVAAVRVETDRRPGGRAGGLGDCEAILRRAASANPVERVTMAHDVERCRSGGGPGGVADSLAWAPYSIKLSNGTEIAAEGATLRVPEYRAARDSRTIKLFLIRLRSAGPASERPLLFLDGAPDTGPSSSTIRSAALFPFFEALSASRDVVLMDYRGTGLSTPLQCPPVRAMPLDLYESRASGMRFFVEQARICADSLRARGLICAGTPGRRLPPT